MLVDFVALVHLEVFSYPAEGRLKPLTVERFQEVINSMNFKSLDRVVIIRRHKDDRRQALCAERLYDTKAVKLRHLYVQKHDIWRVCGD